MSELRALIERASGFCEKHFRKAGEIAPMWHAVRSSGESYVTTHPNELGKDMAAALMRAQFQLLDVVCCLFICEAWTVETTGDDTEAVRLARQNRLEEYPGRIEIVQFIGEDREGMIVAQRKINRTGKPYLEPLEYVIDRDGSASSGRLIGMLPRKGLSS